jgi:hypothetical protein
MRKVLVALAALVLILSLGGTAAAAEPTTVYLVNVLDRDVVDVYLDGNLVFEDFAPGTILGPFVAESNQVIQIHMVLANTVLDPFNGYFAEWSRPLPAGETVAIVAQEVLIPGWLGALNMFTYDLAPTGPGQARAMVFNAFIRDSLQFVFYPGTANEQAFEASSESSFKAHLPAGPTTASLLMWTHDPAPHFLGTFSADLKPGKLYVAFVYFKFGVGLTSLRQEFNVGQ